MKSRIQTTTILLAAILGSWVTANAQLTIPSDGSDGAFAPTESVEIDLGLAFTATWDTAGAGNGVYDPNQWAVVFKYASVNIPEGVTVTFKNHPTYAPVVWLVQGNVTIDGELNLDGRAGVTDSNGALIPKDPGPGGFRGGATSPQGWGSGYGAGGGLRSNRGNYLGIYGNPQVVPLIGGSGGGASTNVPYSGSSGGGAILIAARETINLSGSISANGGSSGQSGSAVGARGSGGAVRLIASAVEGVGTVTALNTSLGGENPGRIRIESTSLSNSIVTLPETIVVPPTVPPQIWPPANSPTARVASVDSVLAPLDPRAPLVAAADVAIQNNDPVNILIETANFPIEGIVQLFVIPKFGDRSTRTASYVSGDITQAIWQVQTALPQGFVTLQARATQP